MIEIEVENKFGHKIFINGVPDIDEIPPEKIESLIAVLEVEISNFYEKNLKRRNNIDIVVLLFKFCFSVK